MDSNRRPPPYHPATRREPRRSLDDPGAALPGRHWLVADRANQRDRRLCRPAAPDSRRKERITVKKTDGRLRSPEEYRASLRDGRRVFYRGEQVADVTAHEVFRHAVEHA